VQKLEILIDCSISSEPTFRAELLSGTTVTAVSQRRRTRLCFVSEFLGVFLIRSNARIGCVILRVLGGRSGIENPLDRNVDCVGSTLTSTFLKKSTEPPLCRSMGPVIPDARDGRRNYWAKAMSENDWKRAG
jgi:hypothetical protein